MSASEDSDSSSFGPIHPDFIKLRESLDVLVEKLVSIDNKLNIVIDKVEEALNTGVRVKLPVFPLASKERVLIVRERAKEENFRMALVRNWILDRPVYSISILIAEIVLRRGRERGFCSGENISEVVFRCCSPDVRKG